MIALLASLQSELERRSSWDLGSIIGNIAGGGVDGGLLMILTSMIKKYFAQVA